jgi:hypothetical protein
MVLEVAPISDDIKFYFDCLTVLLESFLIQVSVTCDVDFTGHGGSRAADYVKQNLFKNLLEHPQFVSDTKLAIGMKYSAPREHCYTLHFVYWGPD